MSNSLKESFSSYIKSKHIPIRAVIQLTYRCNFLCLHCYETPLKGQKIPGLSLNEWKYVLSLLREKGCMFLAFTGGEVFCCPYFTELYLYAYDLGYKITIMSNGSLIGPNIIKVFSQKKPEKINITLYGMSQETYDTFCRNAVAFSAVLKAIKMLRKKDVNVTITFISNKYNAHELRGAYSLAKQEGCGFAQYYRMRAYTNGDKSPQTLQLSPSELINVQPEAERKVLFQKELLNKYDRVVGFTSCNAGLTNLSVDPYGNCFLCDSIPGERYNILTSDFDVAWAKLYEQRLRYIEVKTACSKCENYTHCGLCAPTLIMEYYGYNEKPIPECVFHNTLRTLLGE